MSMDRRDLLAGAGAVLAAAATQQAFAQAQPGEHAHHRHGKGKNLALADSAAKCVTTGEACGNHCITVLEQGDKTIAACARSVNQLIAICTALQAVAAQDGTQLAKLAKVAMDVCKECEDECRKHEKKHQECKDCGDACAACYKECKKLVG